MQTVCFPSLTIICLLAVLLHPASLLAGYGFFSDSQADMDLSQAAWYMDTMGISQAHDFSAGAGAVVALIDSGVDAAHPALSHCIDTSLSFNVADDDYDITDYLGHGTMMAGLICGICENGPGFCGVAPDARLIVYKITSGSGYTFTDQDLAEAITLAAEGPAAVINLSLVIGESDVVTQAVRHALSLGKVVVAAAGNEGGIVAYPAAIDGVVSVGGVDTRLAPLTGSGSGPYLILTAPAYNIGTTISGGGYGATTGTSAASALVSGVFALISSLAPDLGAGPARAVAAQASADAGWPGFDTEYGFGITSAIHTVTAANPLQADPDHSPGVFLHGNQVAYNRGDQVTLSLTLKGVGGHAADMWIQETDPRGRRFYFQYGVHSVSEQPVPYNSQLSSPYLFPEGDVLEYPLFAPQGNGLLSNGYISPEAARGLYEMTVGVRMDTSSFYYSRIILWIE